MEFTRIFSRRYLKLFFQYKKSKNNDDEEFKAAQPEGRLFRLAESYNIILKKFTDDGLSLLGLSNDSGWLDWMILTVFLVPPPPVRPSITADGGAMRVRMS